MKTTLLKKYWTLLIKRNFLIILKARRSHHRLNTVNWTFKVCNRSWVKCKVRMKIQHVEKIYIFLAFVIEHYCLAATQCYTSMSWWNVPVLFQSVFINERDYKNALRTLEELNIGRIVVSYYFYNTNFPPRPNNILQR